VVIVEEKIDKGYNFLNNSFFSFVKLLKVSEEKKNKGGILMDSGLYNMEPYSNPSTKIDLGIELFDIESSWK
jgi:hypothetical protein